MPGKKSKDTRPARDRYWAENRLGKRKVANLVRCCGMSEKEAEEHWRRSRIKRIKTKKKQ